jgi:magnesium chelatase subunit I
MNPEEGKLRSQILDRFGLRVVVRGLNDPEERLEAYRRVQAYLEKPRLVAKEYADETQLAQAEIQMGRELLPRVTLPEEICKAGLKMIHQLGVDSLRAEITLFEAARAYAALDGRMEVNPEDLKAVTPMALRMRRSEFMEIFLSDVTLEDEEISGIISSSIN